MNVKTIIIGIDGGDLNILKRLNLPTFREIFQNGISWCLSTELFSRGWATILTGKNAEDHGGMYNTIQPHRYLTNTSYSTNNLEENTSFTPLWESLNQRGLKVGFFNVPTTFPAPHIDGFFVSGGGGNQSPTWPFLGYPSDIRELIEGKGYINDVRISPGKYTSFKTFLSELVEMTRKRGEIFSFLINHYKPDLGFVCFVGPDRIQHALFRNLEAMMNENEPSPPLEKAILSYYMELDATIANLMEEFKGITFVFVSDHGHAPYHKNVYFNHLLEEKGYIERRSAGGSAARFSIINMGRKIVPLGWRKKIRQKVPKLWSEITSTLYNDHTSTAFAIDTVNSIYINESGRFPKGKVATEDYENVVNDLKDLIERSSTTEFPMKARPYRLLHRGSYYENILPDVIVDFRKDAFPVVKQTNTFLEDNSLYRIADDALPENLYSIISGIHCPDCLFAAIGPNVRKAAHVFKRKNLDEFYQFILTLFE